jgi:hypothetical protein
LEGTPDKPIEDFINLLRNDIWKSLSEIIHPTSKSGAYSYISSLGSQILYHADLGKSFTSEKSFIEYLEGFDLWISSWIVKSAIWVASLVVYYLANYYPEYHRSVFDYLKDDLVSLDVRQSQLAERMAKMMGAQKTYIH